MPETAPILHPAPQPLSPGEGSRPVPDPTVLTTDSIRREITALKELLVTKITSLEAVIVTRLDGMDKAILLIQAKADKVPSETDIAVARLRELHEERFSSIAVQLLERDNRRDAAAAELKAHLESTLTAQKESVAERNVANEKAMNKLEQTFGEQLRATGSLLQKTADGLGDKIEDIKVRLPAIESSANQRLTTIESRTLGAFEQRKDIGASWQLTFGGIGALIGLAGLIVTVVVLVMKAG